MLAKWFSINLYEVEIACTNKEAIQKVIAFAPNLIIIDVWLGNESGRELCKEIKRFNKTVPIILMSANASNLADYEICEADDVIEKPFDINSLLNKVNQLLLKKALG